MAQNEVKRLTAEYAKAAREGNQRAMEVIAPQLEAAKKAAKKK